MSGGWLPIAELPPLDAPVIVAWAAAPWLTTPVPITNERAVCRTDAGDGGWTWAEWQGGPWPVGDDCEWDEDMMPTHWMPLPAPPRREEALAAAPTPSDAVDATFADDAITLSDVSSVLGEIAEDFDGGEYTISDETRRVLIDFAHGIAEHPLFVIVGHHFAQNPPSGATPQADPAPSIDSDGPLQQIYTSDPLEQTRREKMADDNELVMVEGEPEDVTVIRNPEQEAIMAELVALRAAADEVLAEAFKVCDEDENLVRAPVNWPDVSVEGAERWLADSGQLGWRVFISGAAPDSRQFQAYVSGRLAARGFDAVEVMSWW